jgi:hypothetical protein
MLRALHRIISSFFVEEDFAIEIALLAHAPRRRQSQQ